MDADHDRVPGRARDRPHQPYRPLRHHRPETPAPRSARAHARDRRTHGLGRQCPTSARPRSGARRGAEPAARRRGRGVLPAQLRQPGPRAGGGRARARGHRRARAPGGIRHRLVRGAAGVQGVRALQHDRPQRVHRPPHRRLPGPAPGRRRRPRLPEPGVHHDLERRGRDRGARPPAAGRDGAVGPCRRRCGGRRSRPAARPSQPHHLRHGRYEHRRLSHRGARGPAHQRAVRGSVREPHPPDRDQRGRCGGREHRVDGFGRHPDGGSSAGADPGPACYGQGGGESRR